MVAGRRSTIRRWVKRTVERGYRNTVAAACYRRATVASGLGLALYDVTTLYFETPREDKLRKVGMSKERRVDPLSGSTTRLRHLISGFRLRSRTR